MLIHEFPFSSQVILPWIRPHQFESFFQTFKVVCSRVEYAEEPVDELFGFHGVVYHVKTFDILDWLAFTGVQITALPSQFYLGSALSAHLKS